MPPESTPAAGSAVQDPMPGLLHRRAEAERSLHHVLLAGGDTAGVRNVLAAMDAAIVAAKADRARAEANAHRAREKRVQAAAGDLVAAAAARLDAIVAPLRVRPTATPPHA